MHRQADAASRRISEHGERRQSTLIEPLASIGRCKPLESRKIIRVGFYRGYSQGFPSLAAVPGLPSLPASPRLLQRAETPVYSERRLLGNYLPCPEPLPITAVQITLR